MVALAMVATLTVLVGLGDRPYSFYMLLRLVMCLAAVAGFMAARRVSDMRWLWVYGVIAVLYNPLLPLKLGSKPMWELLNMFTLVGLWIGAVRFRGRTGSA